MLPVVCYWRNTYLYKIRKQKSTTGQITSLCLSKPQKCVSILYSLAFIAVTEQNVLVLLFYYTYYFSVCLLFFISPTLPTSQEYFDPRTKEKLEEYFVPF